MNYQTLERQRKRGRKAATGLSGFLHLWIHGSLSLTLQILIHSHLPSWQTLLINHDTLSHWAHMKPLSTVLQEATRTHHQWLTGWNLFVSTTPKRDFLIKSNSQWKTGDWDLDLTGGALATLKFSTWTQVFIHVSAVPRFSLTSQHFLFSRGWQINQLRHQTSL